MEDKPTGEYENNTGMMQKKCSKSYSPVSLRKKQTKEGSDQFSDAAYGFSRLGCGLESVLVSRPTSGCRGELEFAPAWYKGYKVAGERTEAEGDHGQPRLI